MLPKGVQWSGVEEKGEEGGRVLDETAGAISSWYNTPSLLGRFSQGFAIEGLP